MNKDNDIVEMIDKVILDIEYEILKKEEELYSVLCNDN